MTQRTGTQRASEQKPPNAAVSCLVVSLLALAVIAVAVKLIFFPTQTHWNAVPASRIDPFVCGFTGWVVSAEQSSSDPTSYRVTCNDGSTFITGKTSSVP